MKIRSLKSGEFRRVAKLGKIREGRFLKIQLLEEKSESKLGPRQGQRLGLTVSKRYGKAVHRNRFKRLVREAFRLSQHELPDHIAINVRPKATPQKLSDVQADLKEALAIQCSLLADDLAGA